MATHHIASRDHNAYMSEFALSVMDIRQHGKTAFHTHGFSEMVVVLQGSAVHVSPWGDYVLGPGDVFVLHEGEGHGYRNSSSLEIVNVLYRLDDLALSLRDVTQIGGFATLIAKGASPADTRLRLSAERLARVSDHLAEMNIEQKVQPAGWRFAMVAQFMIVAAEICRAFSERDDPAMRALTRLSGVIAHIHANYADNLTLDDLASVANMSRRSLTREFRSGLGMSPIEYLIRERINRAIDLLRTGDLSVTETAYLVGFQDSNYFTRQFHALVGFSPRDARKLSII